MAGESLLDLLLVRFDEVLHDLGKGQPPRAGGPMSAAARAIHQHANRPWKISAVTEGTTFRFSTARNILFVKEASFSNLLRGLLDRLIASDDRLLADLLIEADISEDKPDTLISVFLALFLSHEFFHIDQQLGSDQYRDSDAYREVVTALDYQADVATLWYLTNRCAPLVNLSSRKYLLLLLSVHLATMHEFADPPGERLDWHTFSRLLVWYFQFVRMIRSDREPDLMHPSVQMMPIICLPSLNSHPEAVPLDITPVENGSDSRQDIVIAICDAHGLQRALRMTSTETGRVSRLMSAVARGSLAEVRDELEELFNVHAAALNFLTRDDEQHIQTIQTLSAACALADRLALDDNRILKRDDIDVIAFFERAERLVLDTMPPLSGEGIQTYRFLWRSGSEPALEALLLERIGGSWRQAQYVGDVSRLLKAEILRVGIRLSTALDSLLDLSSRAKP